ncbi:MAG: SH3 domain-containing protein [Eubacteriales bacterium]|nr:SH3 domain-containing protein [Eubacteriales bacterium]
MNDIKDIFERYKKEITIVSAAVLLLVIILFAFLSGKRGSAEETAAEPETIAAINSLTPEEIFEMEKAETLEAITSEYNDFGIVSVDGYINLRSQPDSLDMTNIIGKLSDGAACDIVETDGDWLLIKSGNIQGYASKSYILTGEEALDKAWENIADRVIVNTEVLNIRSAPEVDPENIVGKARNGERYKLVSEEGDWARVVIEADGTSSTEGYLKISDGNGEIKSCLDAARKLDLRQMALTQYDNIVFSYPEGGYINIRKEPQDDGIDNICGKFTKGCGAELLDTVENSGGTWYKIKSGSVTGYVNANYCLTGQSAKDIAVDYARLTAFIKVDALNVRSEPSLEGTVWTSVTKNQAYGVIGQFDGWVELELDNADGDDSNDHAYVSTRDNNVEVRYGLEEAIEYYPAVEAANAAAAFRNSIVNYACQFVGNPYVWGGTSLTNGADCSGFVLSVLKHFGISMPRTSREQAKVGTRITSDQLKPGDLIFYANTSGTINHVGMYIGNGQIVNAASRKSGIKIARWNYRTPAAIRNVIGP